MTASPSTIGSIGFVAEARGDPLGSFPSLSREGRPYNHWLAEQVLAPLLARWENAGAGAARMVEGDFAAAARDCRRAFQEVLPTAVKVGDPALLAALGVTANLQRTAALLGEFIAAGGRLAWAGAAESAPTFRLSRCWCGLIEYPPDAAYFTARIHPPIHASRLNIRRHDCRHLANALWCSPSAITARCEEATLRLRDAIRRSGLFEPGDVEHLRGPSVSLRRRDRR